MTSTNINVLMVIDTDFIKASNPNPSQDPNNPTGFGHDGVYMVGASPRGIISGQGTWNLNFKAHPSDLVSFAAQSVTANAQDAVIVYAIKPMNGSPDVFDTFRVDPVQLTGAAYPDPNSQGANPGLPAINQPGNFITLDSRVRKQGTENYTVSFALYALDDAGSGETQKLHGYYAWDPTITVS